jgi:glycine cleavage system regulatory protein
MVWRGFEPDVRQGYSSQRRRTKHGIWRFGEWSQETVARHLHSLNSGKLIACGRSKRAKSDNEKISLPFCLILQSEKTPVIVQDIIDFMNDNGVQINRLWVRKFNERSNEVLTFQQMRIFETKRTVSEDDLQRSFDAFAVHLRHEPSLFV